MQNRYIFDNQLVHSEYEYVLMFKGYPEDVKPDLSLLALPPPKRFLKAGSVVWASPNVKYTFEENSKGQPHSTRISVKKYHNIDDTKLRLLKTNYLFLRDKDVMSEIKKGFVSLVYNVETKALYLRQFKAERKTIKKGRLAKRHNWQKSIIRLSINSMPLRMQLSFFAPLHRDKFVKDLKRIVSKDVPDVCDMCEDMNNRITALILQHRIGRGIINLNDNCMNNLAIMTKHRFVSARVIENERKMNNTVDVYDDTKHEKAIRKLKAGSVYKFIPTLKDTGSIKKALRVMLGECYVGIYPKILFDIDLERIAMGTETLLIKYKENVPKSIQHYVIQALKDLSKESFKILFKEVADLSRTEHVREHIRDSWIKTVKRLKVTIPWRMWTDTYRMGGELGIRIRSNRFNSLENIMDLHDGFSNLIRRNRDIAGNTFNVDENTLFVKVDHLLEFEGYKFRQILTPKELTEESDYMGHCVHSYSSNCLRGHSIIFSAVSPEGQRWTVEYSGQDYTFIQAEGNKDDNDGLRYFCPDDIIQTIFAPFTPILSRLATYSTPYSMICTLNLATTKVRRTLYALDAILDLNTIKDMGGKIQEIESDVHNYNCVLEDLIYLYKRIIEKTLKTNTSSKINDLLAKVANLNRIDDRILNGESNLITPRPMNQPVPRANAAELFPLIPDETAHEVQQEVDLLDEF